MSDKYKNKERFYSLGSLHVIVITGEAGKKSIICYIRRHVYLRQGVFTNNMQIQRWVWGGQLKF